MAYSATTAAVTHKNIDSMSPRRKVDRKPLPWNGDHPYRQFLFDEIAEGCVTPEMWSRDVHNSYKDTVRSFKIFTMEYSSTFASHMDGLWKMVSRDKS